MHIWLSDRKVDLGAVMKGEGHGRITMVRRTPDDGVGPEDDAHGFRRMMHEKGFLVVLSRRKMKVAPTIPPKNAGQPQSRIYGACTLEQLLADPEADASL